MKVFNPCETFSPGRGSFTIVLSVRVLTVVWLLLQPCFLLLSFLLTALQHNGLHIVTQMPQVYSHIRVSGPLHQLFPLNAVFLLGSLLPFIQERASWNSLKWTSFPLTPCYSALFSSQHLPLLDMTSYPSSCMKETSIVSIMFKI